jgi:hypothetical protein
LAIGSSKKTFNVEHHLLVYTPSVLFVCLDSDVRAIDGNVRVLGVIRAAEEPESETKRYFGLASGMN